MTSVTVDTGPGANNSLKTPRSFREVWLITFGHSLTHWYPATFYLLLPLIGNELGLSYVQIGSILTCQAFCGAISNIPGGLIVDSVSRKGFLMATSLFWVGTPYLFMGFSHEYWMLLTCAGLVGIGNNLWHPTAIPLLARRFPDRRGLVVSIHGMGGNVGDAIAPLVAGALLTTMTWRHVVMLNVVPGILVACILLYALGSLPTREAVGGVMPKKRSAGEMLRDFRQLLGNRTLIFLSTSSIFRSMTQGGLMTFLPIYLATDMGYSPFAIGACMAALQTAGFAAAPIAGHLSDKMGRRQIIMSSMTMTAVIILFMAIAGRSHAFVFFIAFLGFFFFAIRAVLQAWLLDATPPHMGGSAIGLLFGIQAIGSGLGPIICGAIADQYGLLTTFYFLVGTIILSNLLIFFTPAGNEQPRYAPAAAPAE
jgi:FSR family fosmidomycin resistance protein-like MFS transporter